MAVVDSRPVDSTRDNGESLTSFRPYEEPSLALRSRGGGRQVQQGPAKGSGSTKHVTTQSTASTATKPSHPQQARNPSGGPPTSSTKPTAPAPGTKQQERASGSSIQRQQSVPARGGSRKLVSQSSTTSLSGATAVGVTSTGGGGGAMAQSHRSIVEEQIDKIISSNVCYTGWMIIIIIIYNFIVMSCSVRIFSFSCKSLSLSLSLSCRHSKYQRVPLPTGCLINSVMSARNVEFVSLYL